MRHHEAKMNPDNSDVNTANVHGIFPADLNSSHSRDSLAVALLHAEMPDLRDNAVLFYSCAVPTIISSRYL